ncbi:MAG: hypothetical protein ABIR96_07595, partial [Bdellovibrionota bacterium]
RTGALTFIEGCEGCKLGKFWIENNFLLVQNRLEKGASVVDLYLRRRDSNGEAFFKSSSLELGATPASQALVQVSPRPSEGSHTYFALSEDLQLKMLIDSEWITLEVPGGIDAKSLRLQDESSEAFLFLAGQRASSESRGYALNKTTRTFQPVPLAGAYFVAGEARNIVGYDQGSGTYSLSRLSADLTSVVAYRELGKISSVMTPQTSGSTLFSYGTFEPNKSWLLDLRGDTINTVFSWDGANQVQPLRADRFLLGYSNHQEVWSLPEKPTETPHLLLTLPQGVFLSATESNSTRSLWAIASSVGVLDQQELRCLGSSDAFPPLSGAVNYWYFSAQAIDSNVILKDEDEQRVFWPRVASGSLVFKGSRTIWLDDALCH